MEWDKHGLCPVFYAKSESYQGTIDAQFLKTIFSPSSRYRLTSIQSSLQRPLNRGWAQNVISAAYLSRLEAQPSQIVSSSIFTQEKRTCRVILALLTLNFLPISRELMTHKLHTYARLEYVLVGRFEFKIRSKEMQGSGPINQRNKT